jgi:ATP-dependent 26S proteasome regulatory subunit
MHEVEVAARSSCPIIWVRTHEEARFIESFKKVVEDDLKRDMYVWSAWQGIVPVSAYDKGQRASGPFEKTHQPAIAMEKIAELQKKSGRKGNVVVMRDVHFILQQPIPRMLRDIYKILATNRTTLVFLSPFLAHGAGGAKNGLPPTMEKQIQVVDFDLPTLEEIDQQLRSLIRKVARVNAPKDNTAKQKNKSKVLANMKYSDDDYHEFSRALQGLTTTEIEAAATACVHHCLGLNTDFLLKSKKQIVNKMGILEYIDQKKSMSEVGGLDLAKEFFDDYKFAHTKEAQDFGVEPLRGVLLVGIPGCGKSLISKAVASTWGLPLLRLDIGKVMNGIVGSSERQMRDVIQQAEAMAPCCLWIDEIEKALSGTKSSNFSDGGTMARVFGTLLTAMEEGMEGVTVFATANDISMLPPELIRRFSEVFFVDLPGPEERGDIVNIHLNKRGFPAEELELDVDALIAASEDFNGHEIEKAIQRSLAFAYKTDEKKLTTEHVLDALGETKPIHHIMHEKINKMRKEAQGKYRFASNYAEERGQLIKAKKNKMSLDNVELPELEKRKAGQPNVNLDEDGSELEMDLDD